MTARGRWPSVLWPLVLLAVFAVTFRRAAPRGADLATAGGCENPVATGAEQSAAVDIDRLERCATLDPRNAELMIDLGRAYAASKQPEQAEKLYRQALAIDPGDSDVHVALGELLLGRGDADGARREAQEALRWRPNGLAATRLMSRVSAPAEPAR
jgi:tetratricopeptide (TPR) repeat protein